jgi:hypothetical protein
MKRRIIKIISVSIFLAFASEGISIAGYIGTGTKSLNDKLEYVDPVITTSPYYSTGSDYELTYLGKIDVAKDGSFKKDYVDTSWGVFDFPIFDDNSGTWTSEKVGVDFITVKAGPNFVVYSVDDPLFGKWSTSDLRDKDLSHISFWSATAKPKFPGGGAQVPEPATIFLLGSGLLGLFGYRKKFWKAKQNTKE